MPVWETWYWSIATPLIGVVLAFAFLEAAALVSNFVRKK